jgi:hypothetical protein
MSRRKDEVPRYAVERAIHGDSRISYHGTRAEARRAQPELTLLAEAYGRHTTYAVERCPYCEKEAFVVMRYPRTRTS